MQELITEQLPEAVEEVRPRLPEPDWSRRFFNVFDWFRAQSWPIRAEALQQWSDDGTAHFIEGQGDPNNRCELWYSEKGRFFVRIHVKGGQIQDRMGWFQSESCLRMYGVKVLAKCREMGLLQSSNP